MPPRALHPLMMPSRTARQSATAQLTRKSAQANPSRRLRTKTAQTNCRRAHSNPSPTASEKCTSEFPETARPNPACPAMVGFCTNEPPHCTSEPKARAAPAVFMSGHQAARRTRAGAPAVGVHERTWHPARSSRSACCPAHARTRPSRRVPRMARAKGSA